MIIIFPKTRPALMLVIRRLYRLMTSMTWMASRAFWTAMATAWAGWTSGRMSVGTMTVIFNGIWDDQDLADGTSLDCNGNNFAR